MTTMYDQSTLVAEEISDFCHQIKDHGTGITMLPKSVAAHDHSARFTVMIGGVEFFVSVGVVQQGMGIAE